METSSLQKPAFSPNIDTSHPEIKLYQNLNATGQVQKTHCKALVQPALYNSKFCFKTSLELETRVLQNSRKTDLINL